MVPLWAAWAGGRDHSWAWECPAGLKNADSEHRPIGREDLRVTPLSPLSVPNYATVTSLQARLQWGAPSVSTASCSNATQCLLETEAPGVVRWQQQCQYQHQCQGNLESISWNPIKNQWSRSKASNRNEYQKPEFVFLFFSYFLTPVLHICLVWSLEEWILVAAAAKTEGICYLWFLIYKVVWVREW